MKQLLLIVLFSVSSLLSLGAQVSLFRTATENQVPNYVLEEAVPAQNFTRLLLNEQLMWQQLADAPLEGTTGQSAVYLQIPTPKGELLSVRVEDSPLMHPDLAARYPNIKNYRAYTAYGTGRIAVSPQGLAAAIVDADGEFYISPVVPESNEHHVSYYRSAMDFELVEDAPAHNCGWDPDQAADDAYLHNLEYPRETTATSRSVNEPVSMYVYDLALTCTGEFASIKGGTLSSVMAAFNESMALLNAILERETASRFRLVANNDDLIYLDSGTDPFNNSNQGGALLGQVENAIVTIGGIPLSTFDLGHVFTAGCTDVGGVVSGRACTPGKTRGVTCHYSSSIPVIVNRVMSHEIAHQFAVGHSWNNCPPSAGQLASGSAFEPGSGTTIMSYAGSCGGANNVSNNSDDYYHVGSLDQFREYTRVIVPECATVLDPMNTAPSIDLDYEDGFYIPISTPFQLTGTATDADGDNLLFNWEQYDLGPSRDLGDPSGNSPLFRSYEPSADGNTRVFPRLNRIINNTSTNVEVLPTYTRDMTFRLTARDNNASAGGVTWETVAFHATEEAGPFLVTYPNDGSESLEGGQYVEVSWDVANTNMPPVNCQTVTIRLSLDGGQTYPVVLLDGAINNGSAFVTIPADAESNFARLRVDAADNIFFDISNNNFQIEAPTEPGFTLQGPQYFDNVCLPDVVTATFEAGSFLGFDGDIQLAVQEDMLPAGVTAELSVENLTPGESSTVTIDLTNSDYDGLLDVVLEASLGDTFSTTRVITLDVVNNDYSDLTLVSPAEGDQGIQLAAEFDWEDAQYADTYDFQLATSPDFSAENMFDEGTGLVETAFEQAEFFEANTVYYWRVRGENECGPGDWLDPRSFRTINVNCIDFASTDTPLLLPGAFAQPRVSELFVENNGVISDINIPNINLNFTPVSTISITLESPAGTQVRLYNEDCNGFTNALNLGFDDEAPVGVACPPDDQRVFLPSEPLAAFNGENTFGTWKLIIDSSQPGQTGSLNSWDIQFCAGINAEAPFITRNELSYVSPLAIDNIEGQDLRVQDNNFGAIDVTFTLVRAPRYGVLSLDGTNIAAGATFTQQDIYNGKLRYEHTVEDELLDNFSFVAVNPDGGYLPVNYHNIEVNQVLDVSEDLTQSNQPQVFPNPVSSNLQLRWARATTEVLPTQLLDIAGRVITSFNLPAQTSNYNFDLSELPAGIYFLKVGSYTERIVKR